MSASTGSIFYECLLLGKFPARTCIANPANELLVTAPLSIARVSDTLLTSLRGPAESRLKGLAISAGSVHCQILVSTKQDAEEATLEMVTDWHPDLLVIASNGIYDIDRSRHMVCRTPSGLLKVNIRRFSP